MWFRTQGKLKGIKQKYMCAFYQLMGTVETKIMWMKSAWEDKKIKKVEKIR